MDRNEPPRPPGRLGPMSRMSRALVALLLVATALTGCWLLPPGDQVPTNTMPAPMTPGADRPSPSIEIPPPIN